MSRYETPKTIDACSFGRVECPISVNYDEECLETFISFGIKDLVKLVDSAHWYYLMKTERTQRQNEIADLFCKLSRLLVKEKIWSPIVLKKDTNKL